MLVTLDDVTGRIVLNILLKLLCPVLCQCPISYQHWIQGLFRWIGREVTEPEKRKTLASVELFTYFFNEIQMSKCLICVGVLEISMAVYIAEFRFLPFNWTNVIFSSHL